MSENRDSWDDVEGYGWDEFKHDLSGAVQWGILAAFVAWFAIALLLIFSH